MNMKPVDEPKVKDTSVNFGGGKTYNWKPESSEGFEKRPSYPDIIPRYRVEELGNDPHLPFSRVYEERRYAPLANYLQADQERE